MNAEYEAYLKSDEWKKKRADRLRIGKGRCAACGVKNGIQVHHLTYERIFKEDMADLLPLCHDHHTAISELISRGKIESKGDPIFLATETVRLLLSRQPPSPTRHKIKPNLSVENQVEEYLLCQPWFAQALMIPIKGEFVRLCRSRFGSKRRWKRMCGIAMGLYNRKHRLKQWRR